MSKVRSRSRQVKETARSAERRTEAPPVPIRHKRNLNGQSSRGRNGREKVKIRRSANLPKQAKKPAPKLERITFQTSRELDFFSEQELNKQTGHEREC